MSASATQSHILRCPICGDALSVRLARGRKSGKPFVMLLCSADGRHIRAFINDQTYVEEVLFRLEGQNTDSTVSQVLEYGQSDERRSKTKLERGGVISHENRNLRSDLDQRQGAGS